MKRNALVGLLVAVSGIAVLVVGCSKSANDAAQPPGGGKKLPRPGGTAAGGSTAAYSSVQAIFDANCVKCHGGASPKGNLALTSYDGLMAGGEDGKVVNPGDPAGNMIVRALRHQSGVKPMPMLSDALPESDIATIDEWIKAGAKNE